MKYFIIFLLSFSPMVFSVQPKISVDLDSVTISQVVHLVYTDLFPDDQFYIDPVVNADTRVISFRYSSERGDFKNYFFSFLTNLGYTIIRKNNSDFIVPAPPERKLSISEDPNLEIYYYRPKYRDSSYLVEILSSLFTGKFTSQHHISDVVPSSANSAPTDSALAQQSRAEDQLIFSGSHKEVAALKNLLSQVDNDFGQVAVTGVLFEVQTGTHSASALNIVSSLLKDKLNFSIGNATPADSYFSFKSGDLSAITQILDTDSRFKVLSNPTIRVASGKNAVFTVGEDVPVLGSISYSPNSSVPVQAVDYRSSGVIFDISPVIHDLSIDVAVNQEISSFVNTTTGVNNSPTLTKRQIKTFVSLQNDDVVVIGGLKENKNSAGKSGLKFLPDFMKSKSSDSTSSEIILFLKLHRV